MPFFELYERNGWQPLRLIEADEVVLCPPWERPLAIFYKRMGLQKQVTETLILEPGQTLRPS
jgi:hypothetical protein